MSTTKPARTPIGGATALVTGGNRGFGRAIVDELLDRGAAKVYATSRSLQASRDERIVPLVLDVADDDSVAAAAHDAPDVSIAVNNAGIALSTPALRAPLADIRSELETNLFGLIRVSREFAPILARHPSSSLVNVLSVLSWLAFGTGYEIFKAAAWSATNPGPQGGSTRYRPSEHRRHPHQANTRFSPTKPPAPSDHTSHGTSRISTRSSAA
jgi:NAD(P)-dependent dehydrogenase (short-subunit alcohol dehydrogenase family)